MFFLRLNKITIFSNRENRRVLGLFGKDVAEVKIMSFVSTDFTELPNMSELTKTIDPARQRQIIEGAVQSVLSSRQLTAVENVHDNHKLTFGDTGYVVFQSEKIPEKLDWLLLLIEDDGDRREASQQVQDIMGHADFGQFSSNLVTLLGGAVNPTFAAASFISKFIVHVFTERGKKNKDDQIGLLYTSLNRVEHYPHGERKKDDVPDLTQNMLVDYSIFGIEMPGEDKPKRKRGKAKDQPNV